MESDETWLEDATDADAEYNLGCDRRRTLVLACRMLQRKHAPLEVKTIGSLNFGTSKVCYMMMDMDCSA